MVEVRNSLLRNAKHPPVPLVSKVRCCLHDMIVLKNVTLLQQFPQKLLKSAAEQTLEEEIWGKTRS